MRTTHAVMPLTEATSRCWRSAGTAGPGATPAGPASRSPADRSGCRRATASTGSARSRLAPEEVGPVDPRPVAERERDQQERDAQRRGALDVLLERPLHGIVVLQPAQRVVDDRRRGDDVAVVADVVLEFHLPVSAWSQCPTVSEANGDISSTAAPCRAMLRVAATSQRHDHVTRRIHRLHAMHAIVIAMSIASAMGAFELNCSSKFYSGGASWRGVNSESFGGANSAASPSVATATGATRSTSHLFAAHQPEPDLQIGIAEAEPIGHPAQFLGVGIVPSLIRR